MAGYDRYEADPYSQGDGGGGGGGGRSGFSDYAWPSQDTNGTIAMDNGASQRGSRDYKDKYHDQEHERDRDSYRDKYRDQDRERDRGDVYHKDDRERGRERRDRSEKDYYSRDHHRRRERSHERSRERSRGHERHSSERDHGRERRHRHRSHSRSRGRSRGRSHSRSGSQERKSNKRTSGFDMAPPGAVVLGATMPGQIAGMTQPLTGVFPGMFPFAGAQLGVMPMQAVTQQATRHARKVYVGGLPPMVNEQQIASYFSQVMAAIGGNTAGPGDAVVNVYINHEKKFAFVEMRTVEEASNAMALDGILFEGMPVRVRRPSDYNPSLAATLGPSQPSPHLNLAAVGLAPGAAGGAEQDRVFVGGLPYYLTEAQIKELLESFGALRRFDLVKDRETGNSKGYAFCFYQDPAVTDIACAALNGLKMGEKTLTVRRATASSTQPKSDQTSVLEQAQQHIALQKIALQASVGGFFSGLSGLSMGLTGISHDGTAPSEEATRIICLKEVVSPDELKNDDDFEEIYCDMKEECGKYGTIVNLAIPRPQLNGESVPGVGKVFVEYSDEEGALKAKTALNGRKFGGNVVTAMYYPEDKFAIGEFDH